MHLSGPSRGVVSKGSTASGSLSPKADREMIVIAIAEVGYKWVVY